MFVSSAVGARGGNAVGLFTDEVRGRWSPTVSVRSFTELPEEGGGSNLPTFGWKANSRPYRARSLLWPSSLSLWKAQDAQAGDAQTGDAPAQPGRTPLGQRLPAPTARPARGRLLVLPAWLLTGQRGHRKREKVIVSHKADLLFGKMDPGNTLFPRRALHCGQVSPSPAERGARADLGGSRCSSPLGRPPVWVATPLSRDGTSSSASRLSLYPEDPRRRPGAPSHGEFCLGQKQAPARVINISEEESCDAARHCAWHFRTELRAWQWLRRQIMDF